MSRGNVIAFGSTLGNRFFRGRNHQFTITTIEHKNVAGFRRSVNNRHFLTINGDVRQRRLCRKIHIPQVVVNGQVIDIQTVTNNSSFTLPAAPAGGNFQGWYDGTTVHAAGATVTITADVTFTAKYEGGTDGMVQVSTHAARGFIPMMELIDRDKELARLNKEKAKAEKEMAMFANQLNNPKFVERAPAALVEDIRNKYAKSQDKLANIEQSIKALG